MTKPNRLPTIQQLRCFVAVAQELSVRKASARLGMSQPPLSRQIKELELLLGIRLLDRSTHHVSLTAAGELFVEDARQVLDGLAVAVQRLAHADDRLDCQVKMGFSFMFDFNSLPVLADIVQAAGPSVLVQRDYAPSRHLVSLVSSGELDMAMIGACGEMPGNVQRATVLIETIRVALPSGHPATRKTAVRFEDFADLPLFWFSRHENPQYTDLFETVFARHDYRPQRLREPDDHVQLLSRIGAGEGAAFLPALRTSVQHPNVDYRPLDDEICQRLRVPIYLIWRETEMRPAILRLVELFRDHMPAPDTGVTR